MFFNPKTRENNFKLIIDGAPGTPKSVFVETVFGAVKTELRGAYTPLPSELAGEELVMCDFHLADLTIAGASPRLWLFTVPGWHIAIKREIAQGHDATLLHCLDDKPSAIVAAWEKFDHQFNAFAAAAETTPRTLVLPPRDDADDAALLNTLQQLSGPHPVQLVRADVSQPAGAINALRPMVRMLRNLYGP